MLLDENTYEPTKRRNSQNINMNNYVYISSIIKTKNGYRFKLSNETNQMSFLDKTQIFTNKKTDTIIYFDECDENKPTKTYTYNNAKSLGSKIFYEKYIFYKEIMILYKKIKK